MSKPSSPPGIDRRRLARLASDGESSVVLAEIAGLPRLEIEAALKVDPQTVELRRLYEHYADGPPSARIERMRRLLAATVERALEDGELRNLGWAVKGLGILRPLPGAEASVETLAAAGGPPLEGVDIDRTLSELEEADRELWDSLGYEQWPVPPTIPWRPDAPRPRGPLEVENEAGTEAERAAAPLPWPPPRPRGQAVQPAQDPPPAGRDGTSAGEPAREGAETSRWPPHLRPV